MCSSLNGAGVHTISLIVDLDQPRSGHDGLFARQRLLNIAFACRDPDRPSEALSREQAVIAYTLTSAYAEFAEKEKGSLEAGKLADLAVLSQDIFAVSLGHLPSTTSVFTMVGGKVVYDAHALSAR